MPIITKPGSVVSRIEIETSPYKKNTVAIYFAEHAAPDLLENTQRQLKGIGGGDTYMHPVYCVINGNKLGAGGQICLYTYILRSGWVKFTTCHFLKNPPKLCD
jgi:hypothetical protein